MATTPSYGWVTPSPTDFVTDLPADFETFADAVDADLAGLLGGTTGQYLVKDSNTDHDFSWQTLSVPTSGFTQISSTTLGSNTATITFSSIPTTYKHLELVYHARSTNTSGASDIVKLQLNSDAGSNYKFRHMQGSGSNTFISGGFTATYFELAQVPNDNGAVTTAWGGQTVILPGYASSTVQKTMTTTPGIWGDSFSDATSYAMRSTAGFYNSTSAITTITLTLTAGNFKTGSTFTLYGLS